MSAEDSETIGYVIPGGPLGPFARLIEGWHEMETGSDPPAWQWTSSRAVVELVLPQAGCWEAERRAQAWRIPRRMTVRLDDALVMAPVVGTAWSDYHWPLSRLSAGANTYEVISDSPADRPIDFGFEDIRPLAFRFARLQFLPVECPQ